MCKFKKIYSEYLGKPERFVPVILTKSTHFKYAIPNLLNAHKQQELSLPSAPPALLSSHFSPHNNKCLQWRRKVKKSEPRSAQHVFLSVEGPPTLTMLTVLSVVVTHTSTRVQGKQDTLKSNRGAFSIRSASVDCYIPDCLINSTYFTFEVEQAILKCESAHYPVQ